MPGVGNERKDGSFQDIVFVVEEAPHPHFTRIEDDLVVLVQVPWADTHSRPYLYSSSDGREIEPDEEVYVHGLDGEEFALPIPRTLVEGADGTRIVGAGMPVRKGDRTIGKGDLVVRYVHGRVFEAFAPHIDIVGGNLCSLRGINHITRGGKI